MKVKDSMNYKITKLPGDEYRAIYARVPRLCVDLLVKSKNGILLSLRAIEPGKGLWHFPGGTMLKGESTRDVITRIARQETGLEVFEPQLLGVMEFHVPQNPYFHTVSLVYSVVPEEKTPTGSFQGKEIRYFETLPERMIDEHKQFVVVNHLL